MKYFQKLILVSALVTSAANDPQKLTAVSEFEIAETLYRRIRTANPAVGPPPPMDPNIKNRICHHVTSSGLFRGFLNEKPVYVHQMYRELKRKSIPVYLRLFDASKTRLDLVYSNHTRQIDVRLGEGDKENFKDYVFSCVTASNMAEEILYTYYVSQEYNLSDVPNSYIAGRFLFSRLINDRVLIYAIAEEPAYSLLTSRTDAERAYLRERTENEPMETESEELICELTLLERLRVCNLVLSSAYYESELKFVPGYFDSDTSECIKNAISFLDDQVRLETSGKVYEEWMITCRPEWHYATYQSVYFVSRAHNSSTEVFVYREEEGFGVVVENMFRDVRFRI